MTADTQTSKSMCFTFGDPEPILAGSYADYMGVYLNFDGDYYRPPIDQAELVKLMGANAYHGSILHFKKNMMVKWFKPHPILSRSEFEKIVLNYVVTGNSYVQQLRNRFGKVSALINQPAIVMRRTKTPGKFLRLNSDMSRIDFEIDEVIQLMEPDLRQDIYGVPEYFGGIQSVLLCEDSTLFRRKFMLNGNHLGYVLVTNDADIDDKTAKMIENAVKQSKGPGNFRSLYLNIGKSNAREPVKVIPVGDIGSNDEFTAIKQITEREMLAMHRMQPGLSGIIPQNVGGFGDARKIMEIYYELEVQALQLSFLAINEAVGDEVVRFDTPNWDTLA